MSVLCEHSGRFYRTPLLTKHRVPRLDGAHHHTLRVVRENEKLPKLYGISISYFFFFFLSFVKLTVNPLVIMFPLACLETIKNRCPDPAPDIWGWSSSGCIINMSLCMEDKSPSGVLFSIFL